MGSDRVRVHYRGLSLVGCGRDGRNRTLLSPFSAKTGRNQPSTTKFVFGPAKWVRGLIKPEEVPQWVGIMDVLTHLSQREGLPRALPQAMAAGKPVVAVPLRHRGRGHRYHG